MSEAAVFFSDDLATLADCLAKQLFFSDVKPFERRVVIVPSHVTKSFIQRCFVMNPRLGIATGVEFVELQEAIAKMAGGGKILPSTLELSLHVFSAACTLLEERKVEPLRIYLENQDRLFPLCQQLARLFLEYGQHGEGKIEEWLKKGSWQAKIWEALFEKGPLTYPLKIFADGKAFSRFHIFGFSTLPAPCARFFKEQGSLFYLFSPCREFWGDFLSEGAQARQALFWQKRGVKEDELASLENYGQEQHPLLSNWGEAGRFLLEALKAEEMVSEEYYSEEEATSRLKHLQRSILHLEKEPFSLGADDSLQILAAPNRLREVETLLDALKALLQRHAKDTVPIVPSDILVLVADINLYAPYIHGIFGSEESQLGYSIEGLESMRTSPLAEALRHWLGLLEAKFDAKALLALFHMRVFREKQQWRESDLEKIADWIEKAGITWGYDGEQRGVIAGSKEPLEERGSFLFGMDRLLFGLTCRSEEDIPSPVSSLVWTDCDLFGSFVDLLEKIHRDMAYTASQEKRSLIEWTEWIGEISERYFQREEEENWLHLALQRMTRTCHLQLGFFEFCRIVDEIFHRPSGYFGSSEGQVVRFAPFAEGTVLPARVICLLGLEEGAFPRVERATSLAEWTLTRPSKSACDRYLFLQACMLAKNYLRMSYVNSSHEKAEVMPSFVVQELLEWQKKSDPQAEIIQIPSLAISGEALEQSPNFSQPRFIAAEYYYGIRQRPLTVKELPNALPPDLWPEEEEIRLEDLEKCLSNPLSFYFSRFLHLSLKWEEKLDFEEEEFYLPDRKILSLAAESLFTSVNAVIAQAKQRGEFPLGKFDMITRNRIQERHDVLQRQLSLQEVAPETCYTAIFSRSCREPKQLSKNRRLFPAWEIGFEGRRYFITGELKRVCPQGLLCLTEDKSAALIPYWPAYLLLKGHPLLQEISPALLPIDKETSKGSKRTWPAVDPREEMGKLLLYYQKASCYLSPFLAKWLQEFFGEPEKLEKKMVEETNSYAKWLIEQQGLPFARTLCELWRPYLRTTFTTFLENDL